MVSLEDVGVLYVATGDRFAAMALQSVKFLRRVEPRVRVAIATHDTSSATLSANFDLLLKLNDPLFNYHDKVEGMAISPFARTIMMDCDTLAIRPFVRDIADCLESADLVARSNMVFNEPWELEGFPRVRSQFNTGVLGVTREAIRVLVPRWRSHRDAHPDAPDQATFRLAVLSCDLRVCELPHDYNFMPVDYVVDAVRVVHFSDVRARNIFSRSRVGRAYNLRSAAPGTLCIFWRPVLDHKVHPLGAGLSLATQLGRSGRTWLAERGVNRRRVTRFFSRPNGA